MIKKISALLLALAMLSCCLVGCNTEDEGGELVLTVDSLAGVPEGAVAKTANFGFTANQLEYYFNYAYQNFIYAVQSYGLDLSYFGLDTTKPLKDQPCTPDPSVGTWHDYFMNEAKLNATSILVMCEAALAAGYTLSDEDKKLVEENIESFRQGAEEEGKDYNAYLEEQFGYPITDTTLVNTMMLSAYSGAYADYIQSKADVSEEALEKAYEENSVYYETLDYLIYELTPSVLVNKEDFEYCKNVIASFTEVEDAEEFKALAKERIEADLGFSGEQLDLAAEAVEFTKDVYDESEFHNELLKAEPGKVYTFIDEDNESAVAYMLLGINERDESISSRSVRHILFTNDTYEDDTKVREVYDKWVADGASIEDFEALAKEYSEDAGSSETGGLYEGVIPGQMVEEFDEWLFDSDREVGDHAIVETESFGWHIMYYEGGMPVWKYDMTTHIKSEALNVVRQQAEADHPVTFDDETIAGLNF